MTDKNGKRWWKHTDQLLLRRRQAAQLSCINAYIQRFSCGGADGQLIVAPITAACFFPWSCGILSLSPSIQTNQVEFEQNVDILQDVRASQCVSCPPLSLPSSSSSSLHRISLSNGRMLNSSAVTTYSCSCHHGSKFSIIFFFFLGHVSVCALAPYTLTCTLSCDVGGLSLSSALSSWRTVHLWTEFKCRSREGTLCSH